MFDHHLPIVILLPISTQVHKYTVCKPFTIYHLQHGIYYPSPLIAPNQLISAKSDRLHGAVLYIDSLASDRGDSNFQFK